MLNSFNLLFGDREKLSSWTSYLEMRDVYAAFAEENNAGSDQQ
jgi:hypothetical protein